ncbi:PREDICTED: uncharacterized protein LOC108575280 [Habropoda laboriosa]|nr:PREDICTED: uncharacterized protein LOC108575280 [Habropoda laboriosa]
MGVNLEHIEYLACCLSLQPIIIKNRIAILKEMGVKSIGLQHIFGFSNRMRKSLKCFKRSHNIPVNQNIMQNLLNYMGITNSKDIQNFTEFNPNIRTGDYYQTCMLYYKTIYLNLHDPLFYKNRKMKYQSITEISKLVHILKTECKFDNEFLKEHPYLLNLDAANVEEFLTELKGLNINGNNVNNFVKKFPRILFCKADKAKELLELYNLLGIPSQALSSYACALKMDKEIFLERFMNIGNSNELGVWLQHRRILPMIYYYKTVMNRVNYLRPLNCLYNANIQTLLSDKTYFLRFVEGDIFYTAVKKHLVYILRKELGEDKTYVIYSIMRHPYWKHVSLVHIDKMLRRLKKYYSADDICKNIHIILYPRSKVASVLNSLRREYSPKNGYNFTSTQYLALCLYILERKYHFSGDAVWQTVSTDTSNVGPNVFKDICKNESDNLVEYICKNDNILFNVSGVAWLEYLLR